MLIIYLKSSEYHKENVTNIGKIAQIIELGMCMGLASTFHATIYLSSLLKQMYIQKCNCEII